MTSCDLYTKKAAGLINKKYEELLKNREYQSFGEEVLLDLASVTVVADLLAEVDKLKIAIPPEQSTK